jgi:hypothetical protein
MRNSLSSNALDKSGDKNKLSDGMDVKASEDMN